MFEGSQWDDVLYDRIMSDEKLLHVVLSGSEDEECQEECQEECHDLTNFCLLTLL